MAGAARLPVVREEVLGYFENPKHRMDYPTYEANGWYIGSGAVESACKTVVGQRFRARGCVGASVAAMRSVTSGRCTAAKPASGRRSGNANSPLETNVYQRK